jgi:outer membrane protein insertion porin family
MLRLVLAGMLLSICLGASAQKKPRAAAQAPTAWPIASVRIEGLHAYKPEQILAVIGLKSGQMATPKDFDSARQRLLATGAFENVACRYAPAPGGKAYAVTFEVTEVNPRFPIRFEDLGVPAKDVEAALRQNDPFFAETIPATEPLLARYSKAIQDFLAAHGRTGTVAAKLDTDDSGSGPLAVVFRLASARPAVSRVTFTGNVVVPSTALENAINVVAIGLPYKEVRFRQLLENQIRPVYEARGRVRVSFPEVRTEPDKEVQGVVVTVKVDEGASYSMGGVEVEGTDLSQAEIKKLATFKPGDVYNRQVVDSDAAKVESRMRREGYMRVKSTVEQKISDQAKKVDAIIHVIPGQRYTLGALNVIGLDLLTEPAIRKMWGIKPGQPFNSEYPDYFLQRVKEEGILDNLGDTKSAVKTNDENHTVEVTLFFKGEAPGTEKRRKGEKE